MKLLLIGIACISTICSGFEVNEKLINRFTRDVYYRYYLIKRCQEPIYILATNAELWKHINFDNLPIDQIENIEIKNKILALQSSHTIEPFMELWHHMTTHRHLYDASFQKDFIKLLFMLYKSLEKPLHKSAESAPIPPPQSLERMLSIIDNNIDTICAAKPTGHRFIDYKQVTTDDIALNYYLVQRLEKAMYVLSKNQDLFASSSEKTGSETAACGVNINFSHERINYCLSQMILQKNIEPLFHMWQEFIRFRHAGDTHFLKEMLMMLFTVYKDLLLVKLNQESEQVITTEMGTILDLYEHIDELPLDEILHAIDMTTDKLMLLQNMDKKGKQTWGEQYPIIFHTLLALPLAYLIIKTCT